MPNNSIEPTPQPSEAGGSGQLVVSVSTADQVYPVAGATVSITAENGSSPDFNQTSDTDRSGRSIAFTLPAPNASMSQEPTSAIPFSEYTVRVSHPSYFDAVIENVQIFDGILTQLPVGLIPLPELTGKNIDTTVIIPRQNL